ncbi:hypothetical protein ALC60_05121 [Trachymyrmex zeteki]|uniref:Uncharacterized protein n=1 Tax=Mycetomoellerius zeteki TaxID=64791 RepID=A0A151X6B3_9HYME|nr:hypothetical protein ALC60_05121 [Trachymyrmex zeteki]
MISISIGGINTTSRRVHAKHTVNAEQELSPTRKKTKSIVSSPSPLIYAKSRLKLAQAYALTPLIIREKDESESIDRFLPLRAEPFADRQSVPITLTALPKQTRDATNRLRFVHFYLIRRRGYVSFPVVGFTRRERFYSISKNLSRYIIQIDPKIFRYLRKTVLFVYILWVLSPPTTSRCTREREDVI